MKQTKKQGVPYYHLPQWEGEPRLVHGFFTRQGGLSQAPYSSLNVGPLSEDDIISKQKNLERIASIFPVPWDKIFCALQIHGADIEPITPSVLERSAFHAQNPLQADGLITDQKGIYLAILTADCLPVLFLDPKRRAVGAAHAGWRGTLQRISPKTVKKMAQTFDSMAEDLLLACGPSIGPCCYIVGDEVREAFLKEDPGYKPFLKPAPPDRWLLNLAGLNRYQLLAQGVKEENIFISSSCTQCRPDLFFSVRAQGEPTGRQISLIGLRPDLT